MDSPIQTPFGPYTPKWGKEEIDDLVWRVFVNALLLLVVVVLNHVTLHWVAWPDRQAMHYGVILSLILSVIVLLVIATIRTAGWQKRQVARVADERSEIEYPFAVLPVNPDVRITFINSLDDAETVRFPRLQPQMTDGRYFIEPGPEICVTSRRLYELSRASVAHRPLQ